MRFSRRAFLETIGLASAAFAATPISHNALSNDFENKNITERNQLVLLDSNENPYGPSPQVQAAIRNAVEFANRYPSTSDVVNEIAASHHVRPEQVLLGCGSSEMLRVVASAFLEPNRNIVAPVPTFEAITEYSRTVGAEVISIPLNRSFAHDLDGMFHRINTATSLVYICNPNNPTASITPRPQLDAFVAKLPSTTYVLVDEAYHHYAGESSSYASFLDRPSKNERLIVTRTFSAAYGLAGIRIGYAVASPQIIERMRPHVTMQSVNAIAAHCAVTAIRDTEGLDSAIKRNADDRQEFMNQATARMLKPIDSHANFVMMDTHHPANDVIRHFLEHKIAIGHVYPSLPTYIRVSLGTKEEMKSFWQVWDLGRFRQDVM